MRAGLAYAAVTGVAAGLVLAVAEIGAGLLVARADRRESARWADVLTRDDYDAVHAAARRATTTPDVKP